MLVDDMGSGLGKGRASQEGTLGKGLLVMKHLAIGSGLGARKLETEMVESAWSSSGWGSIAGRPASASCNIANFALQIRILYSVSKSA